MTARAIDQISTTTKASPLKKRKVDKETSQLTLDLRNKTYLASKGKLFELNKKGENIQNCPFSKDHKVTLHIGPNLSKFDFGTLLEKVSAYKVSKVIYRMGWLSSTDLGAIYSLYENLESLTQVVKPTSTLSGTYSLYPFSLPTLPKLKTYAIKYEIDPKNPAKDGVGHLSCRGLFYDAAPILVENLPNIERISFPESYENPLKIRTIGKKHLVSLAKLWNQEKDDHSKIKKLKDSNKKKEALALVKKREKTYRRIFESAPLKD